jgi:hypothetical protein
MKAWLLIVAGASIAIGACTSSNNATSGDAGPSAANGGGSQGITCKEILACAADCADGDQACEDACIAQGSPGGKGAIDAISACFDKNGCTDVACVQSKCSSEIQACLQQTNPPPSGSTASTTAPQGSVPTELVGTWTHTSSHGNSSYQFNADGTLVKATRMETNYGCASIVEYASTGTAVFEGQNLTIYEVEGTTTSIVCDQGRTVEPISPSSTAYTWRFGADPLTGEKMLYLTSQYGESGSTRN